MPELPDITVYVEGLQTRIVGRKLDRVRLKSPFLLRTVDPPIVEAQGRRVQSVRRLSKRIVIGLDGDLLLVLHLMIAGRLQWKTRGAKAAGKIGLAAFDFDTGTLTLTEASAKKRASLHLIRGQAGLAALDPGGLEVLDTDLESFRRVLLREDHTIKRALTDPRLFSGIGNAYSDEILHAARLSPVKRTSSLADEEILRLYDATRATLLHWTQELRKQFADRFPGPGDITAFREDFAVHGRFGQPCPACGCNVQRIRYADNETNYCPRCQTGGRLLADRSLSRLLKDDWPRSIEELESG